MRVLFLTFEGIDSTIFNSQVLMHANTMDTFGVSIDILTFNTNSKTRKLSNSNLKILNNRFPKIKIIMKYGVNIYYPFATCFNLISFFFFINKHGKEYDIIHARADYSAYISCLIKVLHKKKVIWDCRGDSLGELKDTLETKNYFFKILGAVYFLPINMFQIFVATKYSDAAIFVSKALYRNFQFKIRDLRFQVIPCPVNEQLFFFDEGLRKKKRAELKIKDETKVFLYSGSMAVYQSVDLQVSFYNNVLKDPNSLILFATSDVEQAEKLFNHFASDRIIIINIPYFEMNAYLNVSDFAILLRSNKVLNNVASPTKFGEYCLLGLPVIMNDTVDQAVEVSKEIGNYFNWKDNQYSIFDSSKRLDISIRAQEFYSRKKLNENYFQFYKSIHNS